MENLCPQITSRMLYGKIDGIHIHELNTDWMIKIEAASNP
jgi:hypothetical protein